MIRPTTAADILDLAPRLREADLEEIKALTGLGPLEALALGLFQSDTCITCVSAEGVIVGVCGIAPYDDGETASVWFLTAPEIAQHIRELAVKGKEWLDQQNSIYPILMNYVTEDNTVHLRLIKYLGFTLGTPFNIHGTDTRVIPFERRRSCAQ